MRVGRVLPLFGESTFSKSAVVTRQRRLNVYFEQRKDADKTKVAIYGTPGLVKQFSVSTPLGVPVRGMMGTQNSLYVVAYNQFQDIKGNGAAQFTGSLASNSGQCSLAVNATFNQVLIVDGVSGYLYTPLTSIATLPASFPNGARTLTFVSDFFVAEQPGSPYFWVSNANDGSTWNSLAFAAASAFPDTILAVDNLAGNLITFSQQHMEFWQASGNVPQPFVPIQSAANEWGLAAIFSRAHLAESIIFLAQNREGQVQFVQLSGFGYKIISDPDIESIVNGFDTVSDAVALSYGIDTHKFYQVSFPTANRTFLYDTSSGIWSEAQTGASLSPVRHTANLSAYYAGRTLVSDYATNAVYSFDPNTYTDNGATIAREIITRHVLSDFDRIRISSLYLDMETGVGLQSGQGVLPQLMVSYSKDNGRTWSSERWVSPGAVGNYLARVILRRFGSTRDATFKFRMTDPVKFVITNGALKVKATAQMRKAA